MKNYHLTILSPEGEVFNDDVICLTLRAAEGDMAVFAGHVPFITTVRPGKCVVTLTNEEEMEGYLETGVLNVSNESVSLLVGDKKFFGKTGPEEKSE